MTPDKYRKASSGSWDPYFGWVKTAAKGKSFVDVGGLWGIKGELITTAVKAGAKSVTMADITPLDHHLWSEFDKRCRELEVDHSVVKRVNANVDAPDFKKKVGTHQAVACGGILYHCPNPVHSLTQLASITEETLIVRAARLPEIIENDEGRLHLPGASAIFIPAVQGKERAILKKYFRTRGDTEDGIRSIFNETTNLWWDEKRHIYDYGPWWWGFTPEFIAGLFSVIPFEVVDVIVWPMTCAVVAKRC